MGARVKWIDNGDDYAHGTVIEVARAYAVKVRWDDRHPSDRDGWHVLEENVLHVPGS